jgi:RNA polymerase primary sigma factor
MGVKVVDQDESLIHEEEAEEELEEYEKAEDLVQAYFYSMGDISILKKDEETELAKRLEEGKKIIKEIITTLPLYKKIEASLNEEEEEEEELSPEEEKAEVALTKTVEFLENYMGEIEAADKKITKYGSLKGLRKIINEKKNKKINVNKLQSLAKDVEKAYKKVSSEVGIKVDDLKSMWDRIIKAKTLIYTAKNELITRNLRLVVNIAKN